MTLPIHDILPALKAALVKHGTAVLVAPPGAGKTTVVPLALMDEPWAAVGRLIVLEPRRLAARAAAARMASTLDETVGRTVGLRMRGDSRVSAATRIEVVTEGVFTRMVLADPGLEGVSAVLFDEFHERSLDADLGLAFARDAQSVLRADLRLLVMSATLDGARVSTLLGGAPVISSQGRAFPVDTRHLARDPTRRLEEQVVRAVMTALDGETGSLLVFLPGAGEIRRTEALLLEALGDRPDVLIAPLYGALAFGDQQSAIAPPSPGVRKVVLATSITETSLTIEGVRVVIDSGFARVPRHDPSSGVTRLATVKVSRAAADQRRGRAGRTGPGVCYRLWDEAETRGLPDFERPEILESDLGRMALDLAAWGAASTDDLALLDAPPPGALAEARAMLARLGALDARGGLTPHGRRLAALPLPPRLGHMVVRGAETGQGRLASRIAALLTERGLGGAVVDVRDRLEQFGRDRSQRAEQARALAERWARLAGGTEERSTRPLSVGELLALAFPERIARRRGAPGHYLLARGRGASLERAENLTQSSWLAVAELSGGGASDVIRLAAPIDEARLLSLLASQITLESLVELDVAGRAHGRTVRRLGAIEIDSHAVAPDPDLVRERLLARVEEGGMSALPLGGGALSVRARVGFLRNLEAGDWPDLSDDALLTTLGDWLKPLLTDGVTALADLGEPAIEAALWAIIGQDRRRELDRLAPERLSTPAGASHSIDYAAEGGPRVEVRVQELFGLARHPTIADGRVPLTLSLTSPAHRPVQLTRDLPGFWAGSWKAVRAEMRGRYPKHPWPEDPLTAAPTTRAKPRGT